MFKAFYWKQFSIILYRKSQTVLIISRGECSYLLNLWQLLIYTGSLIGVAGLLGDPV